VKSVYLRRVKQLRQIILRTKQGRKGEIAESEIDNINYIYKLIKILMAATPLMVPRTEPDEQTEKYTHMQEGVLLIE